MVVLSAQLAKYSGLLRLHPSKFLCSIRRPNEIDFSSFSSLRLASQAFVGKIHCVWRNRDGGIYASSAGRNHPELGFDDKVLYEPFWLSLAKDAIGSLKSLFKFLTEQPSQLKHIEWPSFHSTIRTATLSLILVALFIIVLSSVDSALCYILAMILRRNP